MTYPQHIIIENGIVQSSANIIMNFIVPIILLLSVIVFVVRTVLAYSRKLRDYRKMRHEYLGAQRAGTALDSKKSFKKLYLELIAYSLLLVVSFFVLFGMGTVYFTNLTKEYPVHQLTFTVLKTKRTTNAFGNSNYTYTVKPNNYGVKTIQINDISDISFNDEIQMYASKQNVNLLTYETTNSYDVIFPIKNPNK